PVGFFTMISYGLRMRPAPAGQVLLPPFVLGGSGMGRGLGMYAAFRPPVLSGDGFESFNLKGTDGLAPWALTLASKADARLRDRLNPALRAPIDAYVDSRKSTQAYAAIFNSATLKVDKDSDEMVDGISNRQLATVFGDTGVARN